MSCLYVMVSMCYKDKLKQAGTIDIARDHDSPSADHTRAQTTSTTHLQN